MRFEYKFHFEGTIPEMEVIRQKVSSVSLLDVQYNILEGFMHELSHSALSRPLRLIFEPGEVRFFTGQPLKSDYLSGTVFKVLTDMGGQARFSEPEWAGISFEEAKARGLGI